MTLKTRIPLAENKRRDTDFPCGLNPIAHPRERSASVSSEIIRVDYLDAPAIRVFRVYLFVKKNNGKICVHPLVEQCQQIK